MKKQLRRLVVLAMVVTMFVSSALGVSAEGLRDVFDAKHYADTYKDLKSAFGDNEEELYQHFINYGLKENRQMSPIIDVQAYRAAYPDLEAAFGDNWDAYVEHFLMFGAKENRTGGVLFNPLKYAEAYPDVKEAFGSDIKAIVKHYLTSGIKEGRTAGVVAKEQEKAASSDAGNQTTTTTQDSTSTEPELKDPESAEAGTPATEVTVAGGVLSGTVSAEADGTAKKVTTTVDESKSTAMVDAIQTKITNDTTLAAGAVLSVGIDAKVNDEDVKSVNLTIPKTVVEALDGKQTSSQHPIAVTVKSNVGDITVPVEALKKAGDNVTLEVKKMAADDVQKVDNKVVDTKGAEVNLADAVVMNIDLKVGETAVEVKNLTNKIQVTVPAGNLTGNVDVYFVRADKTLEWIGVAKVEGSNISFGTNHLTQFVVANRTHTLGAGAHEYSMFGTDSKCTYCGITLAEFQGAHAHTFKGDGTQTCTGCRKSDACSPHVFDKAAANGTCTRCGKTNACTAAHTVSAASGTCEICGKVLTHTHTEGGWVNTDAANHWKTCTVCNEKISGTEAAHSFSNWTTEGVTQGNEKRTCSVCNRVENRESASTLGHTHTISSEWVNTDVYSHWKTCTGCDIKISVAAHGFSDWTTNGATSGNEKRTCSVCNRVENRESVSTPTPEHTTHTPSSGWSAETKTGHWKICTVCGEVISGTRAAHTISGWVKDNAYFHWKICTVCKLSGFDSEAHKYSDWTTEGAASGSKKRNCSVCQREETREIESVSYNTRMEGNKQLNIGVYGNTISDGGGDFVIPVLGGTKMSEGCIKMFMSKDALDALDSHGKSIVITDRDDKSIERVKIPNPTVKAMAAAAVAAEPVYGSYQLTIEYFTSREIDNAALWDIVGVDIGDLVWDSALSEGAYIEITEGAPKDVNSAETMEVLEVKDDHTGVTGVKYTSEKTNNATGEFKDGKVTLTIKKRGTYVVKKKADETP